MRFHWCGGVRRREGAGLRSEPGGMVLDWGVRRREGAGLRSEKEGECWIGI